MLDLCHDDENKVIYSGGIDKQIYAIDLNEGLVESVVNSHNEPIHSVCLSNDNRLLISCCYESVVNILDKRDNFKEVDQIVKKTSKINKVKVISEKIFLMQTNNVLIYDLRNLKEEERKFSFGTKLLKSFDYNRKNDILIVGGYDGRIFVEDLNESFPSYSFKSHKEESEESIILYPVNDLCFLEYEYINKAMTHIFQEEVTN